jgi:hypothetical protein
LFGAAFGVVEAAVVIYLRTIAEPIRVAAGFPRDSIFPLAPASALGPFLLLGKIELAREAATILMLGGVAWAAARNFPSRLAAFSLIFGVWDLTFYLWLKVLIGWPASLGAWDLLFLLPVPWVGPVIAPSIVAISLIAGGALGLAREPKRVPRLTWALLAIGASVIFLSFIWDWRYILNGGFPRYFPWTIFGLGELAGIAGLATALRAENRQDPESEAATAEREVRVDSESRS